MALTVARGGGTSAALHSTARWASAIAPEVAVALLALAAALAVGRDRLTAGFPVDDAWIHMVYGLALRREGSLAYNAGIPATGCTSPLWAAVAGLAHLLAGASSPSVQAATLLKAIGVALHMLMSTISVRLARVCVPRTSAVPVAAAGAGALVAACPVLAYAAVSGMEVTLTSTLLVGALLAAVRARAVLAGALVGLAVLARPESIVALPLVLLMAAIGRRRGGLWRALASVLAPAGMLVALLVARTMVASGRPLPATFYAKANASWDELPHRLRVTFFDLLGTVAPTSSLLIWLLVVVALVAGGQAVFRLLFRPTGASRDLLARAAMGAAAAMGLSYVVAIATIKSIALPNAFYFQRYALPGLPLLNLAAALAFAWTLAWAAGRVGARARVVVLTTYLALFVACAGLVAGWSREHARYVADVDDIDAVQVAMGHFVHDAVKPSEGAVWANDAGAIRYWGDRRTVDLMGLNTPEVFDGPKVRDTWRANTVVLVAQFFEPEAADGVLAEARIAEAPSARRGVAGASYTQVAWQCRAGLGNRDDDRILVRGAGGLGRIGRCAHRPTGP